MADPVPPSKDSGELGVSDLAVETRRWSLHRQLFVGMFILTVVLSFAAGKTISHFEKGYLTSTVQRYGENTLNVLKSSALEAVISEDQPILLSLGNELLKRDTRIERITFLNESGKILATAGRNDAGRETAGRGSRSVLEAEIVYLGEKFGAIELVLDLTAEYRAIERHSLVIAGLVALVLISLTVLIFAGLTFSIVRPVAALDRQIRACAEGNFSDALALPPLASKELRRLSYSVALLGQSLRLNRQRTEELVAAKEAAELANRTKSEFLSSMSHELRTPINAIVGFAEMMKLQLLGPLGNPRYREYVDHIRDAGTHLVSLISDILDLAKIEAGKLAIAEEHVDLRAAIDDTVGMVSESAQRKNVRIVVSSTTRVGVLGDRRRLRQILLNLLSNAVKFTESGGRIDVIVAEREEGTLLLAVRDTGIGIAPDQLDKVLEPFGQIRDSSYESADGTGLGLPITKNLAEMHGARFEIESAPGKGTEVRITFPPDRLVSLRTDHAPPRLVSGAS